MVRDLKLVRWFLSETLERQVLKRLPAVQVAELLIEKLGGLLKNSDGADKSNSLHIRSNSDVSQWTMPDC